MVQAVEGDDVDGAVAGARALVTFLESLVRGGVGPDGSDDGMKAGLASARPAPALVCPALSLAA